MATSEPMPNVPRAVVVAAGVMIAIQVVREQAPDHLNRDHHACGHHDGARDVQHRFACGHSKIYRKRSVSVGAATLMTAKTQRDPCPPRRWHAPCLTNYEHARITVPRRDLPWLGPRMCGLKSNV